MNKDAKQFLMGAKARAAFAEGDVPPLTRGGRVIGEPELVQQRDYDTGEPLTWDDGRPKKQLIIDVQTDLNEPNEDFPEDDGVRRFYVKGNLQKAIRQALREARADEVEEGGELYVTFTGFGERPVSKSGKKLNAPREHTARYVKPSAAYVQGGGEQQSQGDPWAGSTTPSNPYQAPPQQQAPSGAPAGNQAADLLAGMDPATRAAVEALAAQQAQGR